MFVTHDDERRHLLFREHGLELGVGSLPQRGDVLAHLRVALSLILLEDGLQTLPLFRHDGPERLLLLGR